MSKCHRFHRLIAAALVVALMVGLVPTTVLAASGHEIPSIIEFKSMTLVDLNGGKWVSRYEYASKDNTFFADVNLNTPSLLRLGFTIEKSQYINLALYKLKSEYVHESNGEEHATLDYYFDPEAEDLGASEPEKFLDGTKIGYICGKRVLNNIVNPSESAEQVNYQRISDEEWRDIINSSVDGYGHLTTHQTMSNIYGYGFKGEKLPPPPPPPDETETAAMSLMDTDFATAEDVLSTENEPTTPDNLSASEEADSTELPSDSMDAVMVDEAASEDSEAIPKISFADETVLALPAGEENSEALDADSEDYAQIPDEEEVSPVQQRTPLPISDVLYDPEDSVTTVSGRRAAPRATSEWAIENYILWDGTVRTPSGKTIKPDYEDGYYVIVLEPCREDAALYNSFLGFKSTTESRAPFTMDGYGEPSDAFFDDWFNGFGEDILTEEDILSNDPVNLLSGSFSWKYTDMALYGKEDLSFTRYYESTAADKNFGLGNGWSSNFTADLTVKRFYAEVHLPQNRTLYFDLDYNGEYRTCGDWTFAWNGDGYTLENTMANTVYTFDDNRILTSISQFGSSPLVFTNDGEKITSVTNGVDSFTFSYNADGNISSVTDSVGRSIALSYNGDELIFVENTDADSLVYTYENGYVKTVQNFKGEVYVENTYDADGRVIHQYAANMGTFNFNYDMENRHNTCTGTDGYLLEIYYDKLNRVIKSTNAEGTKQFTYNDLNQFTSQTDREGNTTLYDHDAAGNISKITYADGTTESYTYDANRRVTAYTDRNGVEVSYTYDAQGHMTSMTDGRGNTTTYTYDSKGNLTSGTDAEGGETNCTYDNKGNRTSMTDALGNKTTYAYDEQGRLISQTTPDGSTTTYEYTSAGKLVKVTDTEGNELTYTVDGNGFNTSESDWMGSITAYERNTQNQITKITDPLGNATTYTYDDRGNLSVSTDANGNKTTYTYDAAGRMVSMTDGEGHTWKYTYDNEGRVTKTTDPLGGVSSTVYDSTGRTTSTTNANGAKTSFSKHI